MNEQDSKTDTAQEHDQGTGLPLSRRGMLAASALGLGMAGGAGSAAAQEEGGAENSPLAHEDHDHSGEYGAATRLGEAEPVERIDVRQIGGSRREGDTVYYDPDDPGPYVDGQDALEDVPRGGTLQIGHGVWDVATEGRLVVDKEIRIRGAGWTKEPFTFGDDAEYYGTVIDNSGDDAIDEPVVEFRPADPDKPRLIQTAIRDVGILHSGQSSPVVRMETIRSLIADCFISGTGVAPTGVKYEGMSFFARATRNQVTGFQDYGIQVTGTGYAHEFYSNHVASGRDNAVAFETQRHRSIIVGGEYASLGENGTAIRFHNPQSSGPQGVQDGGVVIEPGIEHTDVGIDINSEGAGRFDNVQIYHTLLSLNGMDAGVKFGDTKGSKLIYPVLRTEGNVAEWSADAQNCGIITDAYNLANCTYDRHEDASQPYVHATGSAADYQLSSFPTGVPTTVDYSTGHNSPVFHDGSEWRIQGGDGGDGGGTISEGPVIRGSVVDAGHDDFDTIQDAIDFADSNGYSSVYIRPGTYEESITVPLFMTVFSDNRLTAYLNAPSGPAVTLNALSQLRQIRVNTHDFGDPGIVIAGNNAAVMECYVARDIEIEGDRCSVRDSYLTNKNVRFAEGTANGFVNGNVYLGNVNDEGDNTVGSNQSAR